MHDCKVAQLRLVVAILPVAYCLLQYYLLGYVNKS